MRRHPLLWIAALALSGVAAGHSVAYLLAVPNGAARHALLAQTGHSYWNIAITVAVLLELVGVFTMAARQFRAGLGEPRALPMGIPQLGRRLAAIQVAAFTLLEVLERLRSGVPLGEMFHNHLFPIGVLIQILVAVGAALLLYWLGRAAQFIASKLRRDTAAACAGDICLPQTPRALPRSRLCEALRGRAPPVPVASLR